MKTELIVQELPRDSLNTCENKMTNFYRFLEIITFNNKKPYYFEVAQLRAHAIFKLKLFSCQFICILKHMCIKITFN